jgi:hypothetical protein
VRGERKHLSEIASAYVIFNEHHVNTTSEAAPRAVGFLPAFANVLSALDPAHRCLNAMELVSGHWPH